MSIALLRIDDRLIHGQVVVGWGSRLKPAGYLVVDDRLAANDTESDLYRMGLSDGTPAQFVSVEEAASNLAEIAEADGPWIVLLPDVRTAVRLGENGVLQNRPVNLGGVHSPAGTETVIPCIRLDAVDRSGLTRLAELGVQVTAQALPDSPVVALSALLA